MTVKVKDTLQLNKWAASISQLRDLLGLGAYAPASLAFIAFAMKAMDTLIRGTAPNLVVTIAGLVPATDPLVVESGTSIWRNGMYNCSQYYILVSENPLAPRPFSVIVHPYSKIKLPASVSEYEFAFGSVSSLNTFTAAPPVIVPPIVPPVVPPVGPGAPVTLARVINDLSSTGKHVDANGLFSYLATNGFSESRVNPAASGKVEVTASGNISDFFPRNIMDRDGEMFYSQNVAGSWIAFGLSGGKSIAVASYAILAEHYGSHKPKSWVLEGTNAAASSSVTDLNAATWTALDVRVDDTTMNGPTIYHYFVPNTLLSSSQSFKMLRLRQTGKNTNNEDYLALDEVDFYGIVTTSV